MASLVPCSQCQRHVRRSEAQCPFCGAARTSTPLPVREALLMREAKRATLVALGLTLAGQACGGKEDEGRRDNVGLVPPYGLSPGDIINPDGGSGGTGGTGGTSSGEGGSVATVPPYGLAPPPPPDGGSGGTDSPDGGSPDDAGSDDAGVDPDAAG